MKDLNDLIDTNLGGQPSFQRKEFKMGNELLNFHFRDTLQCIQMLYGDTAFVQDLALVPEQHYTSDDQMCRIVNEMHTGDWWWSTQVRNVIYDEHGNLGMFPEVT